MSTTALQTVEVPVLPLPVRYKHTTPAGKAVGYIQSFSMDYGDGSAKSIKLELQRADPELKGKKLVKATNAVLRRETDLRRQWAVSYMQAKYAAGFVPEIAKENAKDTSCTIKLVKTETTVEISEKDAQLLAKVKAMQATDEGTALLAKLLKEHATVDV